MPYNFIADIFHRKKLCSRLSSNEVRFYAENGRFVLLGAWDQRTMIILDTLESA